MRAALALVAAGAATAFQYPYQDPALSIPVRTQNLLSLLSTEEKVALLQADAPAIARIALPAYSAARECERGDSSGPRATVFPSGAALAATWDEALVFAVARDTALEARANANTGGSNSASCFGPVINYIHDVRWGRVNEMLTGEDTTLGSVLGAAFVRGLQSWTEATPAGLRLAVTSTVKHLLSYSGPEGTGFTFGPEAARFGFNAKFSSERAWREFFHPAFRATAKAGARGFMCSYSAFTSADGALSNSPACGSPELLADTVRGEWGWDGFVLSDAGAVVFIGLADIGGVVIGHNATASGAASAVRALTAGCDIELTCCGAPAVYPTLAASIAGGALPASALDTALARVLRNRFELGELDPQGSHAWQAWGRGNVTTPAMVALSADAAAAAIVLLKNEGGLLPLSAAALEGKTLALIGPLGDDAYGVIGGYANRNPPFVSTFLDGLRAGFPLSALAFHAACADAACETYNASAIAVAAGADVVVAALGTTGLFRPGANNESGACGCPPGNAIEGECCDRRDTALPGAQLALLQALAALGKPLVLLLNSGSVVSLGWAAAAPAVAAIVHAPFLGMSAGVGLARVLTGAASPSGKTTLSWYEDAARDLPPMEDYSDASLYNRVRHAGEGGAAGARDFCCSARARARALTPPTHSPTRPPPYHCAADLPLH